MTEVGTAGQRRGGRLIKIAMPAAALLATAAGLILSLLAPHFLPSSEYVEFSLLFGYGQLAATLLFEWSRQAGLRYAYGRDNDLADRRRRTLVVFYAVAVMVLATGGALILCLPAASTPFKLGAIIALYAAAQGVFDARQAFARAAGDDSRFTVSLLSRAILSLAMFAAVALVTRDGILATLALAGSYAAATVVTSLRQPWGNPFGRIAPDQLKFLLAFGLTGAAASIVAILAPNIVRSAAVVSVGKASVGGFLLALDLSQKGLSAIGMVASLILVQKLNRAVEFETHESFVAQGRIHISAAFGVLAPAFIGFVAVQEQMAAVLVPSTFRIEYLAWVMPLTLASFLICVRIYVVDPFFYAHGRSKLVLTGALINIGVLGVTTLVATTAFKINLVGVVGIYVASAAAALVVSSVLLIRAIRPVWPLRDLAAIVAGCLVMMAVSLVPTESSLVGLALKTALCGGSYLMVLFLLDGCGLQTISRSLASSVLRRPLRPENR
ncbi:hypothetical protein [Caulobacter sp. DWR2-3-1b2]|uniref:hypothetical protein n=1 Tax=unclassified Caulobacter TaxID=2648921 RepID=UPI003CF008FB